LLHDKDRSSEILMTISQDSKFLKAVTNPKRKIKLKGKNGDFKKLIPNILSIRNNLAYNFETLKFQPPDQRRESKRLLPGDVHEGLLQYGALYDVKHLYVRVGAPRILFFPIGRTWGSFFDVCAFYEDPDFSYRMSN